jgi:hypothetical protein
VTLRQLHADFSWVVVVTNAIVGLWALGAHYREQLRHRWLWRATLVAQLTMVVQVCMGVALVAIQSYDVEPLHTLYGFSGIATIGILYSYRDQIGRKNLYVLYGLGGLWMMGLAIRGITVSPIPAVKP